MKKLIIITILLTASCGNTPDIHKFGVSDSVHTNRKLKFCFISVGQGDATLITTPNGRQILIDAGSGKQDAGDRTILPLINEDNLELIVASHYDTDHIGGISDIIKGNDLLSGTDDDIVPRIGILDRGEIGSIDSAALSNYITSTSPFRYSLDTGDRFEIDGINFTILGQNGEFMDGTYEDIDPDNENQHSISLLIEYGNISYLTSGDLPGPNFSNEYEPIDLESHAGQLAGDIDILHISHHGSHQSTSLKFLETIKPEYAVISVGENTYGHPSEVVLENLEMVEAEVLRTDQFGDICLSSNGVGIEVEECN